MVTCSEACISLIFVIGGNGYLGARVCNYLDKTKLTYEKLSFRGMSIREVECLLNSTNKRSFACFINCSVSWKADQMNLVNTEIPKLLVKHCSENKQRLVHVSTLNVVQQIDDAYTVSKRQGELELLQWAKCNKEWNDLKIVRVSLLVDPSGDWIFKYAPFCRYLPILVIPKFTALYAPLNVKEAASYLVDAVADNADGEIVNLSGNVSMQFWKCFKKFSCRPVIVLPGFLSYVLRYFFPYYFDIDRTQAVTRKHGEYHFTR